MWRDDDIFVTIIIITYFEYIATTAPTHWIATTRLVEIFFNTHHMQIQNVTFNYFTRNNDRNWFALV